MTGGWSCYIVLLQEGECRYSVWSLCVCTFRALQKEISCFLFSLKMTRYQLNFLQTDLMYGGLWRQNHQLSSVFFTCCNQHPLQAWSSSGLKCFPVAFVSRLHFGFFINCKMLTCTYFCHEPIAVAVLVFDLSFLLVRFFLLLCSPVSP